MRPQSDAFLEKARECLAKAVADYEIGTASKVSPELARQAVGTAKRFVAVIAELLADEGAA